MDERDEIFLRGFDRASPPEDVRAAIDLLRAVLPKDYLHALMREFGYRPGPRASEVRSVRTDLRELDLARFLFDKWVFVAPRTTLAKEFACLSWGEFDIGVFMTLLAAAEAQSGETEEEMWRLDPHARRFRVATEADQNARTAWLACRKLASGESEMATPE